MGRRNDAPQKGNASGLAFPLHWGFFAELERYPEFASIKKVNEEVIQKAKEEAKYEYEIMLPEGYDKRQKYPLFFCLHGDGFCCNKKEQMYYWKTDSIRNKGFIVVYPQSSQIYFSDSFGWLIDPQKAREDMAGLYQEIKAKYSIDEEMVIVAGFSGGATAAVDLAVHNVFPIKGVIALCAGDYLEEETLKDTLEMAKRGTKLAFYEASEAKEPTLAPFLQRLRETGNHYEYHLMEGMGHWYPADIEEKSLKALDYFKSREVMNILIRLENETDYQRVEEITKLAFSYPGRVERGQIGCPYEHWMVHELRKRDGIQQLSLVAEVGNVVVGHIICSEAIVRTADQITSVLNFGPISVLPELSASGSGFSTYQCYDR